MKSFFHLGVTAAIALLSAPSSVQAQRLATFQTELTKWQFCRDGESWQTVSVPHSCNAIDGHSPNYYRGKTRYRRTIHIDGKAASRPSFLLFEGAAQAAEVIVGEQRVARHEGGYTPFVVPLRGLVRQGDNVVEVVCDNREDVELIPVSSDFNKNNGLHNPVYLLQMNELYFSPSAHGLYRMHVATPSVSRAAATARLSTVVCNGGRKTRRFYLRSELLDADGRVVAEDGRVALMEADRESCVETVFHLDNPHLWDGVDDPYLYTARFTLYDKQGGRVEDQAETRVGFRFFEMKRHDGFFLNGRSYPLRGLAMHQDMDGRASAVLKSDIDTDYAFVQELGCNFVRLAHYPHNDYAFRLCDSLGLIVQTEIPWVNVCGTKASDHYFDVIRKQMCEMVTNLYNHPSILFWGMWNELDAWGNNDKLQGPIDTRRVVSETGRLYDLARTLDPYRRIGLTDDSQFQRDGYPQLRADYFSENRYNGWYNNVGRTGEFSRQLHRIHDLMGITNVAEYGAGVNPFCHTNDTSQVYLRKDDARHFEEYGNFIHETHWQQICQMPFLNFTSLWVLFDFPVASRLEGYIDSDDGKHFVENEQRKYMNDKGLVTRDRKTRKDVFYLYKSAWNHRETTVYITSRRLLRRPAGEAFYVKVYSNASGLSLYQNGQKVATLTESGEPSGVIWTFGPLRMQTAEDVFRVEATDGTADEVRWQRL